MASSTTEIFDQNMSFILNKYVELQSCIFGLYYNPTNLCLSLKFETSCLRVMAKTTKFDKFLHVSFCFQIHHEKEVIW